MKQPIRCALSVSDEQILRSQTFWWTAYIANMSDFYSYSHRETDRFFAASGVQLAQTDRVTFHFRRAAFSDQLQRKVGLTLVKSTALRITLNLDGVTIISNSHIHPSHSQTSRLLTSSLSLGIPVPVPRSTQCMRVM
jgi:hypothetical protein